MGIIEFPSAPWQAEQVPAAMVLPLLMSGVRATGVSPANNVVEINIREIRSAKCLVKIMLVSCPYRVCVNIRTSFYLISFTWP